jgi:hypothetical protein
MKSPPLTDAEALNDFDLMQSSIIAEIKEPCLLKAHAI